MMILTQTASDNTARVAKNSQSCLLITNSDDEFEDGGWKKPSVLRPRRVMSRRPLYDAVRHAENSEVLPFGSVAVAVIASPVAKAKVATLKPATPLPAVVTVVEPRNRLPSP